MNLRKEDLVGKKTIIEFFLTYLYNTHEGYL